MLDALRRGMMQHSSATAPGTPAQPTNLEVHKKKLQMDVNRLTHEQKMQVALAIVRLVGFESLGTYNNGCFVDITDWNFEQVKKINDIVQYCISIK